MAARRNTKHTKPKHAKLIYMREVIVQLKHGRYARVWQVCTSMAARRNTKHTKPKHTKHTKPKHA